MGRRVAGEGNVRRRADGRWEARFDITSHGTRRRVSVYGRTRAEVLANLRAARKRAEQGWSGEPQRTTLEQFLRRWLEVTQDRRRPNTNRSYHDVLEKYVIPRLGKARLARLTPLHIDEALAAMATDGVGARTRQMARTVLRAALNDAIRWGIAERNAAALSSPISHTADERHPLTKEQLGALGKLLADDPLEACFLFLGTTGARRGEAVGLCWPDLDLDGASATIRRSLQRVKGKGLVAYDPKTERSKRDVPLAPVVVEAFHHRREAQAAERELAGDAWVETGYVFTTAIGTPIDPAVLTHRWEQIRREIGAPKARLHDLRHTVASIGLRESSDILAVSRLLGHSRVSTTTDIYGHDLTDGGRDVVGLMGGLLGRNGTRPGADDAASPSSPSIAQSP